MNDNCNYFVESWNVMRLQGVPMGYRYCCDDELNCCPILVLNSNTYKDRIINYEQEWKDQHQHIEKMKEETFDLKKRLDQIERKLDQIIYFFKDNPNLIK